MTIVDVIVHIDQELSLSQQQQLIEEIKSIEGIHTAKSNKNKSHLIYVEYNPEVLLTKYLIEQIKESGYSAQLVGM